MTNAPTTDATPPRKKFKYTQQLIMMALEDLTQEEIAKICRVSQSVVSGWKNGQSRAYEYQLVELRRRYAHRLHRATFKVYLALTDEPTDREDWEPMRTRTWTENVVRTRWVPAPPDPAEAARVTEESPEMTEREKGTAHARSLARAHLRPEQVREEYVETVSCSVDEPDPTRLQVVQIEGPVVLRHTLGMPRGVTKAGRPDVSAVARVLVHHLGRDRFVVVRQGRRLHTGAEHGLWVQRRSGGPDRLPVEAQDDAARWFSRVEAPMTAAELLVWADGAPAACEPVLGASLLPFLVRKMLIELGYSVDGVVKISADA